MERSYGSVGGWRVQPALNRPRGDLDPGREPEFIEDVLDMGLRGPRRDYQPRGDFAVGETSGNESRNFSLAWRKEGYSRIDRGFLLPFISGWHGFDFC